MSTIPENEVTAADLATWFNMQQELAKLKASEALLRGKIFKAFFKDPTEGTNNHDLKDGTGAVLKAKHVINRAVDQGSLDALKTAQATQGSNVPKINLDELIKWKPEVVMSAYRQLTDEERGFFDQALVITPGSPQLEIVIPKKKA